MTEKQYRNTWLKQHSQYEKRVYSILLKHFRQIGNSIPFEFMSTSNYEVILRGVVKEDDFLTMYLDIYKEIGILHGKRIGRSINKQLKNFTVNAFLTEFERNIISWIYRNSLTRITSVKDTYINYLKEVIAKGIEDNKTISEITTNIKKLIKSRNFYRWQALRIARTETTAAANYGSVVASRSSGVVTEKVWISANDSRTRRTPKNEYNHIAMNGIAVDINENFKVPTSNSITGYEELEFAGDPKGSAGNIINCRCANALRPKRDKDGMFIFK